jgi:hypothetical protein
MAIVVIPIISPPQYDSFRREAGIDLPHTYDEWLQLAGDHRREVGRQGDTTLDVQVDYDDYIKFCTASGAARDRKSLYDFAMEKKP